MRLVVVRHAHAGQKRHWSGDDANRPLSPTGVRQSIWLTARLCHQRVARLIASPALRCRQTLSPLATLTGLKIEVWPALATNASGAADRLLACLLDPTCRDAVICTHGELLSALYDRADVLAAAQRLGLSRDELLPKGSSSELLVRADGTVDSLAQLRPTDRPAWPLVRTAG
jgi:phosphohistidine phosphatase SixA